MGTPLPENLPSTPCPNCFGPGKPFVGQVTPRYLKLTLRDYSIGDEWVPADESLLLTPHYLTQQANPCQWFVQDSIFNWAIDWDPFSPEIRIWRILDSRDAFNTGSAFACLLQYADGNTVPTFNVSYNGIVDIEFAQEAL